MNPLKIFFSSLIIFLAIISVSCNKDEGIPYNDNPTTHDIDSWNKRNKFKPIKFSQIPHKYELLYYISTTGEVTNLSGTFTISDFLTFPEEAPYQALSIDGTYSKLLKKK